MTQFITITSGKGGAGKTTVAINLGTALAQYGRDVLVVDGNLHNPNIASSLGNPLIPSNLYHVSIGQKNIREVAYKHPSGLKIIPGSIVDEIEREDFKRIEHSFLDLMGAAELVIIDTSTQAHDEILNAASKTIMVTTPDMTSVTDALRAVTRLQRKGIKIVGVIINKVKGKNELGLNEIGAMLGKPIIGEIPYDEKVEEANFLKHPVLHLYPESQAARSYRKIASALIGR